MDWTKQHIGQESSYCAKNEQDEHCNSPQNCMFRNIDGTCVFETCLYDERPKENYGGMVTFNCPVSLRPGVTRHIRDLPVGRISQEVEDDLPEVGKLEGWTCVFCGGSFSEKRFVPFHNICEHCRSELKRVIDNHTC